MKMIDDLNISPWALLATIDIEALYNSIPNKKGLLTIKTFLDQMDTNWAEFNKFVLNLLSHILNHNIFLFVHSHYLQG